jgi:hypothetical protein
MLEKGAATIPSDVPTSAAEDAEFDIRVLSETD